MVASRRFSSAGTQRPDWLCDAYGCMFDRPALKGDCLETQILQRSADASLIVADGTVYRMGRIVIQQG